MRDLEINIEEERDVDPSKCFRKLKEPYLATLTGEWDAVKSFFEKYPQLVFSPLTEDEDTAFHIAAYSGENEALQHLVCLVPPSRIFEVLSRKNVRGNNTFHDVATTNNVESAELLVTKLLEAYGQVRGSNLFQLKELLEDRNQEGETPLFMAAARGHTKMAKFLAKKVGNISHHFQRNYGESVLHIAIEGQSFDTGIWLLGKDKQLASRMGKDGLTCLQLLAKMPAAFRSSYSHCSRLNHVLYYYLPNQIDDDDDDDDDADLEDLESGQSSNSFPKSKKHSSGSMYPGNNQS
ncbi:isoform 2 of ankyrin repeat-containing protein npr4 [Fagus crenata]